MLTTALMIVAALGAEPEPWKKVVEPRAFSFPRDHAAHADHRVEWWYYTGNLAAADGRRFGYELTFFRTGLQYASQNPSRWAVRDLYLAHFAVSDLQSGRFHCFQRLSRRGVGWSGAETDRCRVWNGDWTLELVGDEHRLVAAQCPDANQPERTACAIDLRLVSQKPPALHGDRGISRKGPTLGNASYYYSLTRMETRGTIRLGEQQFEVSGLSWMDHEFSSSFLEAGQRGWDWFSIQLDDGREMMLYQLRRDDGTPDRFSSGTWVEADGRIKPLTADDFSLSAGRTWRSPQSGAEYPVVWKLRLPARKIEMDIAATMPNQELDVVASTGFPYWEGAIDVRGREGDKPLAGRGYLEMTGYAGRLAE